MMSTKFAGLPLLAWVGLVFPLLFLFLVCVGGEYVTSDSHESIQGGRDLPLPPDLPHVGSPTDQPSCEPPSRISWADAGRFLNRRVAMIGPVSQVTSDGTGARLVIGYGPGEYVTVQILPIALQQLFAPPEQIFTNKTICVIGVIHRINGELRIIVNKPSDLSI